MFANWPPLGFTHAHTFGGVYSDELLISYRSGSQGLREAQSLSAQKVF